MVEAVTAAARFWEFALALYGNEAARAAFLDLQDQHGADVPMLLWCLWRGSLGAEISETQMREAVAFSTNWRRVRVDPVRALRRGWKGQPAGAPDALAEEARQQLARAEQAIERLQMDWLAALPDGRKAADSAPCHAHNLALYARICGIELPAASISGLLRETMRLRK